MEKFQVYDELNALLTSKDIDDHTYNSLCIVLQDGLVTDEQINTAHDISVSLLHDKKITQDCFEYITAYINIKNRLNQKVEDEKKHPANEGFQPAPMEPEEKPKPLRGGLVGGLLALFLGIVGYLICYFLGDESCKRSALYTFLLNLVLNIIMSIFLWI